MWLLHVPTNVIYSQAQICLGTRGALVMPIERLWTTSCLWIELSIKLRCGFLNFVVCDSYSLFHRTLFVLPLLPYDGQKEIVKSLEVLVHDSVELVRNLGMTKKSNKIDICGPRPERGNRIRYEADRGNKGPVQPR